MSFRLVTELSPAEKVVGSNKIISQLKVGDFNGDGNCDVFVSRIYLPDSGKTPSNVQVLLGDGRGGLIEQPSIFSASPQVYYPVRSLVADFNNDGKSDIFCADTGVDAAPFSGAKNSVFLSTSTGLSQSTSPFPTKFTHGAAVGDVNRDGNIDVLVNTQYSSSLQGGTELYFGSGDGGLVQMNSKLPPLKIQNPWGAGQVNETHSVSNLIDVNADGYLDLVLGGWNNPTSPQASVIYLSKLGDFSTSSPISIPLAGLSNETLLDVNPIDLNGDNLADLVMSITSADSNTEYRSSYVRLMVNKGNGQFADETQQRLSQSLVTTKDQSWYKSVSVVDFNHDGFSDLIADTGSYLDSGKVFMNDGTGKFSLLTQVLPDQRIAAGDVDGDGMMDIVASPTFVSSSVQNYQVLRNEMENKHVYKANFGGESLLGSKQNDTFISSSSADKFTGNGGVDTVRYSGKSTDFKIDATKGTVTDSTGVTDVVSQISRIKFDDKTLAFDVNGNAGQGYRIYQAAFDRKPDVGGLSFWVQMLDSGKTLEFVASQFIASAEFAQKFGQNSSTATFVNKLYQNVLHRDADTGGMNYWQKLIDTGSISRAQALVGFSESNENQVALVGQMSSGIELL